MEWLLNNSEVINWVFTGAIIALLLVSTVVTVIKVVRELKS